ncbi:insulinase family protein [Marinihelvus fidelis]|uniref:Insulinase family protein n=1 Tax=Marinihelvus fidelis TaxID=2613842 RepID=A0A5N0THF6_9GAMM|nr:pitrilysin family protein [Marinihelvus fidelis]KAA9134011.1 insulinase family protein [Marinihelvus fidelis]
MKLFTRILMFTTVFVLAGCQQDASTPATTAGTPAATPETAAPAVAAALPAGVTLVEEFDGDDRGISIPYKKYTLANGLTVVLHEDHSDPLVHVDVTYHVGSDREEPGRSGFAHFFEHMMFQGSENVGDDEHFKIVSNAGGTLNGTTNTDRTNYYETVPVNQLETVLWLEADRMGVFLDAVTQEKFEIQRETVKNERGQRVDNRPYGRALETLMQTMYPEGHPYSWPVIGWIEDLNAADLDDLKRFFLRWYGPNNATLTVGGDIDVAQTLEWVNTYFGPIPAGPEVDNLPKQPASLDGDRYVTLEDNIHLPALAMMQPTVYSFHQDEPALDAAAKILGQGQASLLYQRLVQTGRAVQASVNHACKELACEMWFIVIQNPASGESLAEMEAAVRETIAEFAERPVSEDDLTKFKADFEAGRVFGLQSVAGKVSTLAAFETFTGSPAGIGEEIDRYLSVTTEDVQRVFDKYIDGKPAVVLSIVPNGKPELAAAEQNFNIGERDIPETFEDEGQPLALRPVSDTFDRSIRPTPGVNPSVELPPIGDVTLANGVRLLAVPNDETPTVTIRAVFDMGLRDEPPGKAGLTALTSSLMGEATQSKSAAEFAEAMERIGARVYVSPGMYETTVTLNTLAKHLDTAIPLFMERIMEPAFTEEDFARVKQQTIEGLMQNRKTPEGLASRAIGAVLDGPDNPLSYPVSGLPHTVETITLDDVKAYYAAHVPTHLTGVTVSSSLPQERVVAAVEPLAQLEVTEAAREPLADRPAIEGRTVYLVDKEGAAQSSIRTGQHGLPYDALGDYYRAGLANFVLGGTFSSRVNLNLREDKGYTYGARTGFSGGPELGSFRFSAEVNKDATAASVTEVLNELQAYDESGMTPEDFDYMRSAIGQRDALQYETPGRKLGLLDNILRYDLPLDYRSQQNAILQETDRDMLNALASRLIDPDNMAIVIVGDESSIREEIEALGMPIVELDEDGYVIGE